MMTLVAVGLGGGAGAICRYLLVRWTAAAWPLAMPWGTLAVNVLGSFAAGILFVLLAERGSASAAVRGLWITGFLGGFTTFSAFSLETLRLLEGGRAGAAGINAALNLLLSLAACAAGLYVARRLA